MRCPRCRGQMSEESVQGVQVDRCGCGAIWFDRGELERLRQRDRESASRGRLLVLRTGEPSGFTCPRCTNSDLETVNVDSKEVGGCRRCSGLYVDGEVYREIKTAWRKDARWRKRLERVGREEEEGGSGGTFWFIFGATLAGHWLGLF